MPKHAGPRSAAVPTTAAAALTAAGVLLLGLLGVAAVSGATLPSVPGTDGLWSPGGVRAAGEPGPGPATGDGAAGSSGAPADDRRDRVLPSPEPVQLGPATALAQFFPEIPVGAGVGVDNPVWGEDRPGRSGGTGRAGADEGARAGRPDHAGPPEGRGRSGQTGPGTSPQSPLRLQTTDEGWFVAADGLGLAVGRGPGNGGPRAGASVELSSFDHRGGSLTWVAVQGPDGRTAWLPGSTDDGVVWLPAQARNGKVSWALASAKDGVVGWPPAGGPQVPPGQHRR